MSKRKSKKRNSSNVRNEQPQQGSRNDYMKAFAKKLIDIIKQADANGWQKGWKSNSFLGFPQNYRGSSYSGGNSMFLLFMSRLKGYKTPIFLTLKQADQLDSSVKKGEHGVPVFKWGFSYRDKDGKKYDEKQVNAMSKEERDAKGISGHPFVRTYTVFNLDQTNYAEVHKKRYELLLDKYSRDGGIEKMQDTEGMFKDEAIDKMVSDNQWVCPVKPDAQQDAYYSAGCDIVVVPTKSRFKIGNNPEDIYTNGMEYYSTMFHEMAHSTGHPSRLNRTFGKFGTPAYAREELVAESTAALLSMSMGYNGKVIKNSGAYLANWQRVLAGKPEDIVKIMSDVSKASDMIIERIDKQRVALNQASVKAGVSEGIGTDLTDTKPQGKSLFLLQAQYDQINGQYPFAVDDDRTRQIAKRINQAKEIMTAYNNNVAKAYGDDFLFSQEAMTTIIPHAVYSGREQVKVERREQAADTVSEPQSQEGTQEKGTPSVTPTSPQEEAMEKQTANGVADDVSPAEDSNFQTDVAGVAEQIMETGHVSKETAEKKAATIVEAQQAAVNEKKQKADQAKQEAVKKADEARKAEEERRREAEEQRRREEENNRQGKDGGPAAKIALHAALLLGALELAKGNKGVWMNKAGKSNAEFLWAKTPITPYNNMVMNIQSDQKGYRSNIYAYFDELKNVGDSVKTNEKALPFNWTRWDYQNIATKEVITKGEYQGLPEEEKSLYVKHHTRQTQQIFNIDQTSLTGKEMYRDLLKETGAKYEELSERGVTNMIKYSEKLKSNHPTAIVVARNDNQYHIYGNDATKAGKILGLPVGQTEVNGQKIKSTGFPLDRIDDYLPKLVQAKQWVVVADNLDSAKLIRSVPDEKEVLDKAYSTARNVAKAAGMGYERVMVLQSAEYDGKADKIIVSGMADKDSGSSRQAAIEKANDIYRAVVAATGSEQRLDRMGRNNLLPKDDAKYERFVQDLASGVLMARQGLPATLSKESMGHIGYWQRELRENPKLVGLLEKDVNNAVESIDKHLRQQAVRYEDIRKDLPPKDLVASPRQFQISTDLAKLPDIDSKEIVIVRDKAKGAADVILPEGASLEDNVEISGIRKDRIRIALGHEGITNVKFYNAGGALGLKEPNGYYKDKAVSMERLKQYELNRHKDIDVTPQIAAASKPKIEVFTHIRDEKGQYAFFFKPENEPSFSVYPNDAHKRLYFDVRGTDRQQEIHDALAQKYYSVAKTHPEIKAELVMPKTPDVDVSKIERPTITRDKDNPAKKYVTATIGGEFMKKEITKSQWDKMWLADDMSAYKRAVAAVVFEPVLKASAQKSQAAEQYTGQPSAQTTGQSASQTTGRASGQGTAQNTQQPEMSKTGQMSGKDDSADDKEEAKEVQQDAEAAGEENTVQTEENARRPKGVRMG